MQKNQQQFKKIEELEELEIYRFVWVRTVVLLVMGLQIKLLIWLTIIEEITPEILKEEIIVLEEIELIV